MQKTIKPAKPVLIEDLGMLFPNETSKHKSRYGIFKCICGSKFKSRVDHIKNEKTSSCGCYNKKLASDIHTTHGLTKHRLYKTWNGIINRTTNKNHDSFNYYGGRGIKVCCRWLKFENFIEDMYPTFKEGLTIDRIDNDGNYEPSNCRWDTKSNQSCNTRLINTRNTSGYRGVYFNKRVNKWHSQIGVNGGKKHLGYFNSAIIAAIAYNNYIIENNLRHTKNII